MSQVILEQIADLRQRAKNARECADHADRYEYQYQERRNADRLDAEANRLEAELKKAGES